MSVNTTEPSRQQTDWADDEIDLRQYADVLIAWWKEILFIAVIFALIAGLAVMGLRFLGAPQYAAAADVAILRTVSEVTFDERFTTTSDNQATSNAAARRNALVALAVSPALAETVIAQMGDDLTVEQRQPTVLAETVKAELVSSAGRSGDSDLIRITASAETPEKAAQIVTAWAQAFVREVNQIYGQVPDELLQSIQGEQAKAQTDYQTAQKALEQFIAQNRVDELSRSVADTEATISALQNSQQLALDTLIQETVAAQRTVASSYLDAQAQNIAAPYVKEQEGRRNIVLAYVDALYRSKVTVFEEQAKRDIELLRGYYTRWLQITRSLDEAATLRNQVASGSDLASGGSTLATHVLKLQALTQALDPGPMAEMQLPNSGVGGLPSDASPMVATNQPVQVLVGGTPLQIQLNADGMLPKEELLADIDALVTALQTRKDELEGQITTLSEQLLTAHGDARAGDAASLESALMGAATSSPGALDAQALLTATAVSAPAISIEPLVDLFQPENIEALVAMQNDGRLTSALATLEDQVRAVKADLEGERARLLQLTQQRDLAWETYSTVSSKVAELALMRAAAGSEVRFAAPGVAPSLPVPGVSLSLTVAMAGVVGLLVGVMVAFIGNYLGKAPFLSRRQRTVGAAA